MSKRILIAMSDTGGGHRAVSRAVAEALSAYGVSNAPIIDLFAHGDRRVLADRLTRLYGPLIRRAPRLYGAVYHATNRRLGWATVAALGERPLIARARALLSQHQPDVVVSIHGLVTRPFLKAIQLDQFGIPLVTVVPDLVRLHRSWVQPGVRCYTAPTDEVVQHLERWGVPRDKIFLTGLPADSRFGEHHEPAGIRLQLGLDPDRFTALIVGGGEGSGNLPRLVATIDRARLPLQLIVVCGHNQHARKTLDSSVFSTPVRVYGFATNMPELVKASDIVVTKGGPQSIVESLMAGRPVLVTQVLPGQERGNDKYVERHGAGYVTRTPARVVERLRQLTTDPNERLRLAEGAHRLGHSQAADRVARVIMNVVK